MYYFILFIVLAYVGVEVLISLLIHSLFEKDFVTIGEWMQLQTARAITFFILGFLCLIGLYIFKSILGLTYLLPVSLFLLGIYFLNRRFNKTLMNKVGQRIFDRESEYCPACGYSLRGLEPQACPECGWTIPDSFKTDS